LEFTLQRFSVLLAPSLKSAVSENFIDASRGKSKELMERPLGELRRCAVLIDGTPFKDRQMIVALGIGCDGRKTVLGLREGARQWPMPFRKSRLQRR
jgi:transposase-like protein